MENKRKALGTGLEQLFNNENISFEAVEKEIIDNANEGDIKKIPIKDIRPNPYQPRKRFDQDKLQELSDSIKEHGLFQPIIVKKSIKGYELIAGERRTKAAELAGFAEIPAIVKEYNDEEMLEIAILENTQRENLNPIEEAEAYKQIIEKSSITQEELSKKVSKSRSYITNILGLVNLPEEIKVLVIEGRLSMAHARTLSKLEDEDYAKILARRVVNEGISVHALEDIVRSTEIVKKHRTNRVVPLNREYAIYENAMREITGSKVTISAKKVIIPFDGDDDLVRILESLNIDLNGE